MRNGTVVSFAALYLTTYGWMRTIKTQHFIAPSVLVFEFMNSFNKRMQILGING
jgi:hypothetical protein